LPQKAAAVKKRQEESRSVAERAHRAMRLGVRGALVLVLLAAPSVVGNMRAENIALRTSLHSAHVAAPTQQMQAEYAGSQQTAERQEQEYVQQQQQYAQEEEQQYAQPAAQQQQEPAAPAYAAEPAEQGYAEPGEVPQYATQPEPDVEAPLVQAVAAPAAEAQPWPPAAYNAGEPLVTTQTEDDARK